MPRRRSAGTGALLAVLWVLANGSASLGFELHTGDILFITSDSVVDLDPGTGTQTVVSSGARLIDAQSIALASDDSILVTDRGVYDCAPCPAVVRITPSSGAQDVVSLGADSRSRGRFGYPGGVANGPGGLFVNDGLLDSGVIYRVDTAGGAQAIVSRAGVLGGGYGLTEDANGDLIVATGGRRGWGALARVDAISGAQEILDEEVGSNLYPPVTLDRDGRILACAGAGLIGVDPNGGGRSVLLPVPSGCRALGVDRSGGIIIAKNSGGIVRFDAVTQAQTPIAQSGLVEHLRSLAIVPGCAGDCNDNRRVTIDELVRLVNLALDIVGIPACIPGDANGDDRITIDELIKATNAALVGCGGTAQLPPRDPTPAPANFAAPMRLDLTDHPNGVVVDDFNSDGDADLVVSDSYADGVVVALGDGRGGFTASGSFAAGDGPVALAAARFREDGPADLVTANYGGQDITVLLGDGNGGFAPPLHLAVGSAPRALVTGQMNADRYMDVAATAGGRVALFFGDGRGGFRSVFTDDTGGNLLALALADVNEDGRADLVMAEDGKDDVLVALGSDAGQFSTPVRFTFRASAGRISGRPESLAIGDFNGDRHQDIVVADGSSRVFLLPGDGTGRFGRASNFAAAGDPEAENVYAFVLTSGDFNGDERADIVTANTLPDSELSVLLQQRRGGFAAPDRRSGRGSYPAWVSAGDLNHDTFIDLVVANSGTTAGNVTIFYGAR